MHRLGCTSTRDTKGLVRGSRSHTSEVGRMLSRFGSEALTHSLALTQR